MRDFRVVSCFAGIVAATLAAVVTPAPATSQEQRITVQQALSGEPIPADHRIAYGDHPMQFGDLRIPDGEGPWPFAILIHGGCWQDMATLQYFDRVAAAITAMGVVTWNIEYRPADVEGGGWPNTFLDVARGVDKLRDVALEYDLGMQPVITLGHSSGGHLALWAAGRPRVPEASELYVEDPLPVGGVGFRELDQTREFCLARARPEVGLPCDGCRFREVALQRDEVGTTRIA